MYFWFIVSKKTLLLLPVNWDIVWQEGKYFWVVVPVGGKGEIVTGVDHREGNLGYDYCARFQMNLEE